jgi:subtilisin/minor extracellular protease Epr
MKRVFGLTVAFLLIAGILPFGDLAGKPVMVPVIIGFETSPDPSLISSLNGRIKHVYTIIPAVAATIPQVALDRISKAQGISFVELDYRVKALGETLPWGVDRIDAEKVHAYPNKGVGVQVAIIDTGIDHNHPDLYANYLGGYDFVNGDSDPMDDNGHGTHCAGTVAALDNTIGVIGVAPETELYALKVLDSSGSGYTSDVISGIEWAVKGINQREGDDDDAEVISMSLGSDQGSTALQDACNYAYDHGTLVVAAAGNDGNAPGKGDNVDYPGRYPTVIAVAAFDINDVRARFSSTGPDVELAAPGVDVYSTYLDDTYATGSGTSMACPHVSGVAALVFAACISDGNWNGNLADYVREILDSTAEDLGYDTNLQGYGLVDAEAAVNAVGGGTSNSPPNAPSNPIPNDGATGVSTSPTLSVDVSDPDGDIMDVSFYDANTGNPIGTDTGVASGGTASVTWSGLSHDTTYSWYAVASDGVATTQSQTWKFTTESSTTTGTMHLESVYLWLDRTRGPWEDIGVKITVKDSNGNPLNGVTVDIKLETPEGSILTGTATTDSSGVAITVFEKTSRISGTYTATVTGLTKSGYTWDKTTGQNFGTVTT